MKDNIIVGEVVRTLVLGELPTGDDSDEPNKFRIEVLRDLVSPGERFYAQMTRWETYRMTPRFPGEGRVVGDVQSDVELLMVDDEFRGRVISGNSIEEVVDGVLKYMRSRGYIK